MRYNITSTFQKILGLQSALKPSFPFLHSMSTKATPAIPNDASRILDYWFSDPVPMKKWFGGGPTVDKEIKTQFEPLIVKARASQLDAWKAQPESTLALVILLDQFPRNIYRGTPSSFSSDGQALNITTEAIAKGFDRQVPLLQQGFFYMPLMHNENLLGQVASLAMFELLAKRCQPESEERKYFEMSWDFSAKHRDCILKFGRFPSRNEILGRESTLAEIAHLNEFPNGF